MSQSLLSQFGTAFQRVESAINALQSGKGVLLVDDEDRENEGDLIFSTQHLHCHHYINLSHNSAHL